MANPPADSTFVPYLRSLHGDAALPAPTFLSGGALAAAPVAAGLPAPGLRNVAAQRIAAPRVLPGSDHQQAQHCQERERFQPAPEMAACASAASALPPPRPGALAGSASPPLLADVQQKRVC